MPENGKRLAHAEQLAPINPEHIDTATERNAFVTHKAGFWLLYFTVAFGYQSINKDQKLDWQILTLYDYMKFDNKAFWSVGNLLHSTLKGGQHLSFYCWEMRFSWWTYRLNMRRTRLSLIGSCYISLYSGHVLSSEPLFFYIAWQNVNFFSLFTSYRCPSTNQKVVPSKNKEAL